MSTTVVTPKKSHSFLRVFESVLHAAEVAAQLAEPIIATFAPEVAGLMGAATSAAVSVESSIATSGSGAQKAAAVTQSTEAAIGVINSILVSKNKPTLPASTGAAVSQVVGTVVGSLNSIADAVDPPAAA